MLTFEEARRRGQQYFGHAVNPYGFGDAENYYIGRSLDGDEAVQDGEVAVVAVNRHTGATEGCPPYPTPDCGLWTATERFAEFPPDFDD